MKWITVAMFICTLLLMCVTSTLVFRSNSIDKSNYKKNIDDLKTLSVIAFVLMLINMGLLIVGWK